MPENKVNLFRKAVENVLATIYSYQKQVGHHFRLFSEELDRSLVDLPTETYLCTKPVFYQDLRSEIESHIEDISGILDQMYEDFEDLEENMEESENDEEN